MLPRPQVFIRRRCISSRTLDRNFRRWPEFLMVIFTDCPQAGVFIGPPLEAQDIGILVWSLM
jgi:hypothetical protein